MDLKEFLEHLNSGKTVLSGYVSSERIALPFFIVFGDERHTQ